MARKNVIHSFKMIDDGDASADITSSPTSTIHMDKASIRIEWSGTPVGTVAIQAQQRKKDERIVEANWFDVDLGSTVTIDGTDTEHQILFNELPFTDLRVKYTSTSGTGTINVKISAKQVGG